MVKKVEEFHLWKPLLLLLINIFFILFLIEEVIDASPPNYGYLSSLTAGFGLVSFLYIRKYKKGNYTFFIWILQGLNWFFIVMPFVVIVYLASYFI